jgi:hypothetical protein
MKLDEIIRIQIDTAIAGLIRTRARISGVAGTHETFHEVDRQLETVASHVHDIQYNWLSLMQNSQTAGQTNHARV